MKRIYFKQSRFTLYLLSFSFIAAFVLVACKKDKLTEPNRQEYAKEQDSDNKADAVIKRIKNFERQLKDVRNGTLRSDVCVDVDSALWNMESLFNTTYSSPEKHYVEKTVQELFFDINMYRNNQMSLADVGVLYEKIVESVREAYKNDGFTHDKGLMSIVFEKENANSRSAALKVVVISGRTSHDENELKNKLVVYGPFKSSDCFYYGEYGGTCNDPDYMYDAAEALEDTINYYYGTNSSNSSNKYRNIYVDMTYISLKGNEYQNSNGYELFYKINCDSDKLYLNGYELNQYYYNEKKVILQKVPSDPQFKSIMPENPTFMEVNIDGLLSYESDGKICYHQHYILYGTKYEASRYEVGNVVDILSDY